jgi:hypothetical protein
MTEVNFQPIDARTKIVSPTGEPTTQFLAYLRTLTSALSEVVGTIIEVGSEGDPPDAVGGGGIDVSEQNAILKNAVGLLTGTGSGTVFDRLREIRTAVDELAEATALGTSVQDKYQKTLSVQMDDASAAITEEQTVRANADGALAESITTLQADLTTTINGVETDLSAQIQEVDLARVNGDSALAESIDTIGVEVDTNAAAIAQEAATRADAFGANALLIDEAVAETSGVRAAVLMKAEAATAPAGVTARYQIVASVAAGGATYQTGILFDLLPLGGGVYKGRIHLMADQLTVGDPDSPTAPFAVEDDQVKLTVARAGRITSSDGMSMIIDFDNPEITIM